MTSTDKNWEAPAPRARPGRKPGTVTFAGEAAQLRANPGQWLRVRDYPWAQEGTARTVGVQIRTGRYTAFRPAGAFEAETRTVLEGKQQKIVIWARFIGEHGEFREVAGDAP